MGRVVLVRTRIDPAGGVERQRDGRAVELLGKLRTTETRLLDGSADCLVGE